MNWQGLQRRLLLPVVGGVLGVGGYLAMVRPAAADMSLVSAYRAIWDGRGGESVVPMLHALSLDPGSPERWADLAEAMHETGRDDITRYCLENELRRGPGLPHVAMRVAGMYFRLNDPVAGLRLTNRVLNETNAYDANVFQAWQRLGGTAADVFEYGVGSNTRAGRAYVRFLLDSGEGAVENAAAGAAWAALEKNGMAGVDDSRFYAASLAASHEFAQAAAIESRILPDGIWNGGFENEWTGRGLDWKVESVPGITVVRDTTVRHGGAASLRLEFDGTSRNEFSHVSEMRVLPGGRWVLRAMVRTDLKDTSGEAGVGGQGIGFRVVDAENGRVLAETAMVSVIHDWTPVEATLDAGSHARLVRIEIVRPLSRPSEYTMSGTAWVDDVSITMGAGK
jgi:hypothetical protein